MKRIVGNIVRRGNRILIITRKGNEYTLETPPGSSGFDLNTIVGATVEAEGILKGKTFIVLKAKWR